MKGRLRSTFLGGFAFLAAALLAALAGGFLGSGSARARLQDYRQAEDLRHRGAQSLRDVLDLRLALSEYLRSGEDAARRRFESLLAESRSRLAELAGLEQKDLQRERARTAAALLAQWAEDAAGPQVEARQRLAESRVGALIDPAKSEKALRELRGLLDEYVAAAGEDAGEAARAALLAFGHLNLMLLAGGLLAGAVAAGLLFHFLKTLVRPVEGILAWSQALRAGRPFALEIAAGNELGELADAFSRLGEELRHARREVEQLAMTPETSPHPVLELKADGSVAYANPAAKALAERFGFTPAELLPPEASRQLAELSGKDALARRERALGEARYDFVLHGAADRDTVFAAAFERPARKP